MSTYDIRTKLVEIARLDRDKVEVTKNTAPWIAKLWPATSYPDGMANREPYCAAGVAYCLREWLKLPDVLAALQMAPEQAEKWRCKSAAVREWVKWAKTKKLRILPSHCILKRGDLAIYSYSHIEIVTDDDNTTKGPFIAIGFNTNASASRDGEGCFEKPRTRTKIECFIRILE